jgi:hypothetical protein
MVKNSKLLNEKYWTLMRRWHVITLPLINSSVEICAFPCNLCSSFSLLSKASPHDPQSSTGDVHAGKDRHHMFLILLLRQDHTPCFDRRPSLNPTEVHTAAEFFGIECHRMHSGSDPSFYQ